MFTCTHSFFYIGTIVAILLVVPWQNLDLKESPLVTMLQMVHWSKGAGMINFIILVASLSSMNSAIYSTSRILYNTAKEKIYPNGFYLFLPVVYRYMAFYLQVVCSC